jgi:perosamine synthetase
VRLHGLVPVPIDIDLESFEPLSIDLIKKNITPKSKVMVFANLYGIRYQTQEYIPLLKEHGIDIIEDCA